MKKVMIRGGTLWSAEGSQEADLVIGSDGRIEQVVPRELVNSSIDSPIDDVDVIDASGLWVLPGAIDAHVHFREPGLTQKEDFLTGSRAAAMGGVTTVIDMPNTLPPVIDGQSLGDKQAIINGRSFVDYGLFGAVIADESLDRIVQRVQQLVEGGVMGLKVLLGPTTGNLSAPDWGQLYQVVCEVGAAGSKLPFVFHCEDRSVIQVATSRVSPDLAADYEGLMAARPRFGEIFSTEGVLRLAEQTGARVHIAHVALAEAALAIGEAKRAGVLVSAETGPQYLFLSEDDFTRVGDRMKVLPPIRTRHDQIALWQALACGDLDFVATDHAPHEDATQPPKYIWEGSFGMAGVQTMLPLLLDRAIHGLCGVDEVVRWTSYAPARTFGLYPQKGTLSVGSDADLTLVDPAGTWKIERPWWQSKSANTAFWGRSGLGKPRLTMVRGQIVVQDDKFVGEPFGKLICP